MEKILEKAMESKKYIEEKINIKPKIAIILGSGLGKFVEKIEEKVELAYEEIPNFPVSTIVGHSGKLITGKINNIEIMAMSGRFHYYEGYSMAEATFPIRVFSLLGVEKLIITNAAGGVNEQFDAGELMVITDHIKFSNETPLRGKNIEEFGTRFPDMRNCYNKEMIEKLKQTANKIDIKLNEGVYFYMAGPQYETPSEVRMIRLLGGDAVGMSTVPEAIVANHCGMKILGISCITNTLRENTEVVTHEEVMENGNKAANNFAKLVTEFLKEI